MLGAALSPGSRSYLKRTDQRLKYFLSQYPNEFSIDCGKGGDDVRYTPSQSRSSNAIQGSDAGIANEVSIDCGKGGDDVTYTPSQSRLSDAMHASDASIAITTAKVGHSAVPSCWIPEGLSFRSRSPSPVPEVEEGEVEDVAAVTDPYMPHEEAEVETAHLPCPWSQKVQALHSWLVSLDHGKGSCVQFEERLIAEFDASFSQIAAAVSFCEGVKIIDPAFFTSIGVKKAGHRMLLTRGLYALVNAA